MTELSSMVTLTRRIGPAEQQRRDAILAAAGDLVSQGGYDACTVRTIAARAGTTPATVYRYFGSKDQLLHRVMVDWAANTVVRLRDTRYTGDDAARVSQAFQDIVRLAAGEPALLSGGIASFLAPDAAGAGLTVWQEMFTALVRAALDDDGWSDDRGQAFTLGQVLVASMLDLTSGRSDPDLTCRHIDTAARLIFR